MNWFYLRQYFSTNCLLNIFIITFRIIPNSIRTDSLFLNINPIFKPTTSESRFPHSKQQAPQIHHQLMVIRFLPVFIQIGSRILHGNLRPLQIFKLILIRDPCHVHADLLPLFDQIRKQHIIIVKIHPQVILHFLYCHNQLHHLKSRTGRSAFSCQFPCFSISQLSVS